MRLKSELPAALKYQAVIIESAARDAGLDSFEVVFELLDATDVNGVAAYGGFPVRYPSWRFGMEFERLEKTRRFGLSKIYELVINNDPTYAYLVRANSVVEQKLVMAHVYGHADFFKNNLWFAPSNRHMLDLMGEHSTRLRRHIDALGQEKVEQFLDLCLSLDTLLDPYLPLREHAHPPHEKSAFTPLSERSRRALELLSASPIALERVPEKAPEPERGAHAAPTHDVLGFLGEHAPLESWQRDVLGIVRTEAYYFAPQRMTKIMNEGWASFWHSRLLTQGILEPSEIVDFADCHSSATACTPGQINPYKLGIELFRYAEEKGEEIFRLRRVHNDVSLLHKLVDEEFVTRHLGSFAASLRSTEKPDAPETAWTDVKLRLLQELAWGGLPQIELRDDGDPRALSLVHHYDGRDLQLGRARETLQQLAQIWRGPVHLWTIVEKQGRKLSVDGASVSLVETRDAEERCLSEGMSLGKDPPPRRAAS